MDTLEAIAQRRSVRKYADRSISEADLDTILRSALAAPSGLNLQPWYFVAVKSPEKRRELLQVMDEVSTKIAGELEQRFAKHPEVAAETRQFIRTLGNAPVILLAFMLKDDYQDKKTVLQSVSAAVENALLAARALGIGSCWLTAAEQTGYNDAIRDRFAPGKGDMVAMVSLGWPESENWPRAVARKDGRFVVI